ncbi:MAG: cell surface protein [Clostridiales bacterium]|jgi:hypothetical protein|nr:cell surface protein [Clostridiales bacterium]
MTNKVTKLTLLALAIFISFFIGTKILVNANEDLGYDYNGYEYTIKDGKVTITKYVGYEKELIVPSLIDNKPVVMIADRAFYQLDITSVTIPEGVISLGGESFRSTKLETVVLPKSLIYISNFAFAECRNLKSITIHNNVEIIGPCAFSNTGITTISIPASTTVIGEEAFNSCNAMKSIHVDYANKSYKSIDGVLFDINGRYLVQYPNAKSDTSYTIPNGVIVIMTGAFYDCKYIESVVLPNNLLGIGKQSFYGCTNLANINIPEGILDIGQQAFFLCNNLQSVILPDSIVMIGPAAFGECDKLTSFHIPANVNYLSGGFLNGCDDLESITVDPSNPHYTSYEGVIYTKDMSTLVQYPCGNKRTSFTVPEDTISIGNVAFQGSKKLVIVTMPETLQHIGEYAFWECVNIARINFPRSLTTIGEFAFAYCQSLKNIVLPSSLTHFGQGAFMYCEALTTVKINGNITCIPDSAFFYCLELVTVLLPTSVTEIKDSAFYNCIMLSSLETLNRVEVFGENIFGINDEIYSKSNVLTIKCYKHSMAHKYAVEHGIPVIITNPMAKPTTSPILLDGKEVKLEGYTIDGFNYFKLRDIAYLLNNTQKQFDVTWEGSKKIVEILQGHSYTITGEELKHSGETQYTKAEVGNSKILINNREVKLTVFEINGYNYFKLRDLGSELNLIVLYNDIIKSIEIRTE